MNRRYGLSLVGVFALALAACGNDTSSSNNVTENSSTTDMASTPDGAGGDDMGGANNITPNNVVVNNDTSDMGDTGGGGDDAGTDMSADAGDDMTIDPRLCGNAMLDPGEDCDDANEDDTDECNSDCTFTCGDGIVGPAEQCDTAIAAGDAGACPSSCDDADACTTDALQGNACQAQCVYGTITACTNADGCCPTTCNAIQDDDCAAICGNAVVEPGETCDGNCPADCNDNVACTADVMAGTAATCDVMCTNTLITACVNADGCCPPTCTSANDTDCSSTCGNNVVEPPELCDGNCPTVADCADNNACTADTLQGSAGQCNAQCVNTPLGCVANLTDGCCPMMCNANNDGDCAPACGNGVIETGESCDDMNMTPGDGCDAACQAEGTSVAFRMSDLDLMDPHVYLQFLGCRDITNGNVPLNLSPPINGLLQNAIQLDEDNDGALDLSFVAIFTPLDQADGASGAITVAEADCTAPMASTTCTVDSTSGTFQTGTYTTDTMQDCLDVLPSTTRPYTPAVNASTPPCFVSTTIDLTIDISGILVPLSDVQIGATYVGNPATGLANGLLRGFISEADADMVLLPGDLPLIGGDPLSSVLAGGGACASHDDRDIGPDGSTMGWWFYLNFPATVVPVTVN